MLADGEALDVKEWVKRSRQRAALDEARERRIKRQKVPQNAEKNGSSGDEEEKYSEKDLAGIRVSHSANDFELGEHSILTLRDQDILEHGENGLITGLVEEDDELENVEKSEADRRREAEKRAKKASLGAYVAYDDDEFEIAPGQGIQKSILSHYDEELSGNKKKRQDGFVLGSEKFSPVKQESISDDSKKAESLEMKSKLVSDYYTVEEVASFKKPKKMRRKVKKSKHDLDDTANLQDSLLVNAFNETNSRPDHGSRASRRAEVEKNTSNKAEDKKLRFDRAMQKAVEKSETLLHADDAPFGQKPKQEIQLDSHDDDIDSDLQASLARARRLAQLKIEAEKKRATAEEIAQKIKKEKVVKPEEKEDGKTDGKSTGLVFTSAMEFTGRMQSVLQERLQEREQKILIEEQRNILMKVVEEKEEKEDDVSPRRAGTWSEEKGSSNGQQEMEKGEESTEEKREDEEEDDQLGYMLRQPLARSSVAATLSILKQSGELKKKEELSGRAKDRREVDDEDEDDDDGIKIEYRDEYGRQMTRAEAFRQLNYQFHGYGPGKKKLEKRMRAVKDQKVKDRAAVGQSTLGVLKKVQESTSRPFVTLQSGSTNLAGSIPFHSDSFELQKGSNSKASSKTKKP